jgi:hypothetical protein
MRRRWMGLLAVPAVAPALAAPCDDYRAIWANDGPDSVRHVIYHVDTNGEVDQDAPTFGYLFIEEWRERKLAWRTAAPVTCSNGVSTCYALVRTADLHGASSGDDEPRSSDSDQDAEPATNTIIEMIDENADKLSEWVVLAGLGQELYYSGGAKVEWYNGFKPEQGERATAPNHYRYAGCRTAPVLPEKSSLFVKPAVCDYYRKTGSLDPGEDFKPYPGSIVWMKGNEIGGGNLKCKIRSFSPAGDAVTADCSDWLSHDGTKETQFGFAYGGDHVVLNTYQRLDLCEK